MYNRAGSPANKANTQADSVIKKRFIKTGHTCLGVSDGTGLTLTGADRHDSLLWSRRGSEPAGTVHSWSPYGSGKPAAASLPGFNGERLDPVSGTYHLGKGYRAYNSVLMRFNCPDDLSPFGAGGINPYAYCAGDPVNHIDPSGHLGWQAILGITLGAIGLAAVIFTGGASIIAAGGVMAAVSSASATALTVGSLGVVADVTAIASGAVEGSDPEASSILGWVSLATGIVGAGVGLAGLGKSIRGIMKRPARIALFDAEGGAFSSASKLSPRHLNPRTDESIFIKVFEVEARRDQNGKFSNFTHTGYTNNFRGTGEPGMLLHGNELALTDEIIINGISETKFFENMVDFVEHVFQKHNIDLITASQGKRLHLASCHATGEAATAQRLANVIRAPVVSYGPPLSKIFTTSIGDFIQANPNSAIKLVNRYGFFVNAEPYIHYPGRIF